jgi:putative transposase
VRRRDGQGAFGRCQDRTESHR